MGAFYAPNVNEAALRVWSCPDAMHCCCVYKTIWGGWERHNACSVQHILFQNIVVRSGRYDFHVASNAFEWKRVIVWSWCINERPVIIRHRDSFTVIYNHPCENAGTNLRCRYPRVPLTSEWSRRYLTRDSSNLVVHNNGTSECAVKVLPNPRCISWKQVNALRSFLRLVFSNICSETLPSFVSKIKCGRVQEKQIRYSSMASQCLSVVMQHSIAGLLLADTSYCKESFFYHPVTVNTTHPLVQTACARKLLHKRRGLYGVCIWGLYSLRQ